MVAPVRCGSDVRLSVYAVYIESATDEGQQSMCQQKNVRQRQKDSLKWR